MDEESLTSEIERLMREPVSNTTLGLTGWVQGTEGVERAADKLDAAAWNSAVRELIFAILDGEHRAILRLAEELEKHNASC